MRRFWMLAFALGVLSAGSARAYPDRPITLIVAFTAGGGTDVAARTLARFMQARLGQPIVVVNRVGAGGEIGWTALARAAPDGYTIGFVNTPNVVTLPIERRTPYALESFAPIANVVDDPGGIFVRQDSPIADLAGLLAAARADPDRLTYGSTGVGSDDHLAMLSLQRSANVRLTHVAYNGSAAVRQALLGGELAIGALNMGEGVADMRQGLIRPLGQMGTTRWAGTPDVPTLRELGHDVVEGSMRGLVAPAGTPATILRQLADAARDSLQDAEFQRLAEQQSLPLRYLDPEAYGAELVRVRAQYEALWRSAPWRE